jgi:hypothetical protein
MNQSFANLTEARKNLSKKQIRDLLNKAFLIAKDFRMKETELIEILKTLDHTKAYRASGYNSLYRFCVESLQLSEHQSYQYIAVARKCEEVPELFRALESQRITVSKARKLTSVLTAENQKPWLELAEAHSQKDLEKAVRAKAPLPLVRDHLQILSETEVKLQATLTAEVSEKLARVIELISERREAHKVSINEAIDEMCEQYLEKQDPVRKAERALRKRAKARGALGKVQEVRGEAPGKARQQKVASEEKRQLGETRVYDLDQASLGETRVIDRDQAQLGESRVTDRDQASLGETPVIAQDQSQLGERRVAEPKTRKPRSQRLPIPAASRHHVMLRDQGQCRYHRKGVRCERKRYLEIHHRIPVADGGGNAPDNLVLLCSEHHKAVHWRGW